MTEIDHMELELLRRDMRLRAAEAITAGTANAAGKTEAQRQELREAEAAAWKRYSDAARRYDGYCENRLHEARSGIFSDLAATALSHLGL